jgi:hypothetical protein
MVFKGNILLIAGKGIVLSEKQHAVALFALLHGHTGAVPINGFDLGFLIFVVATGAQGRAQ